MSRAEVAPRRDRRTPLGDQRTPHPPQSHLSLTRSPSRDRLQETQLNESAKNQTNTLSTENCTVYSICIIYTVQYTRTVLVSTQRYRSTRTLYVHGIRVHCTRKGYTVLRTQNEM